MNKSNMQLTSEYATKFWNDTCHMETLAEAIQAGAVGATSNPSIVGTLIKQNSAVQQKYLEPLIANDSISSEEALVWKAIENIAVDAAKVLHPIFEKSNGVDGRLSLQVNPIFYRDKNRMLEHGIQLASLAPNITIKAPCIPAGLSAMDALTANGITVNGTVSFTVSQAIACAEAIERGLQKAKMNGIDISKMSPCVTIMVGRVDDHLKQVATQQNISIDKRYLEWAGVAVFKNAYRLFIQRGYRASLLAAAYRNNLHWLEFVGGNVILTIPPSWWKKFNNTKITVRDRMQVPVQENIVNELYNKFADFRKSYDPDELKVEDYLTFKPTINTLNSFLSSYYDLLNFISEKRLG